MIGCKYSMLTAFSYNAWQCVIWFLCTLLQERSIEPPFKAEAMPLGKNEEHVFVFTTTNSENLQMKLKKTSDHLLDCPSQKDDSNPAAAVRYIDSQELYMLPRSGGILTHRHIIGHLLECWSRMQPFHIGTSSIWYNVLAWLFGHHTLFQYWQCNAF